MSEPLFLQSVMQEKIWGGTKLRDEFGYDMSLKLPMVATRE